MATRNEKGKGRRLARSAAVAMIAAAIAPTPAARSASCTADPSPIEGCEVWSARYNHATQSPFDVEADFGNDVAASPDGSRVFVTGRSWGSGTDYDMVTLAYDAASGKELWSQRFEGAGYDYGAALAVSPDGAQLYSAGTSDAEGDADYLILAHDAATGSVLWSGGFDGGAGYDFLFSAGITDDGRILVVTGYSQGGLGGAGFAESLDYGTVAFDAQTGATMWTARYDGGGGDQAFALVVGPDTRELPDDPGPAVYVTGMSASPENGSDFLTLAYDAETGAERWAARTGTSGFEAGVSVDVTPDDATVVVTGGSEEDNGSEDFLTAAYDAETGAERWVSRFDGPAKLRDTPTELAVSDDGSSAYVTGASWKVLHQSVVTLFEPDYMTIAYDVETGQERWRTPYDGGFLDSFDVAFSVALSPDSRQVFVSGASRTPGVLTYATLAIRAEDGSTEWIARTAGTDGVWSEANRVATDGERVYVTGAGMDDEWFDVLTVAYEA